MTDRRPDPDALLKRVQDEEGTDRRGRLKVFLGASAGVGKTYAMLSEAHEQRERGVEVVAGYVETHKRKETEALLQGIEILPLQETEYRGVKLQEFDLDGALKRKPQLMLVDELAHSNIPGSRHAKRWQDVEELLRAGIDVYTTVNIQHLESLNDVVAKITGVIVRETVPDSVLERADKLELIDIPPEELQQRLREGKVYVPDRIEHALEGFFQRGNLMALRELALRRAADRVDAEMRTYRTEQGVGGVWAARDRVIVCIAPNRLATRVVRAAGRLGAASHAEIVAVYVESDRQKNRSAEDLEAAREALRLAESLGMETVTLGGHDIVREILLAARQRNATLVVVGKPIKPRWREILFGSVVDELVRHSGDIDVHVITGEINPKRPDTRVHTKHHGHPPTIYIQTAIVVCVTTAVCFLFQGSFERANLVMIYLLGVAFVASKYGTRPAVLASFLSVAIFDVAFVPPRWTLAVSDSQYLLTFGVMLVVSLLIGRLTTYQRDEAQHSSERERRTAALYSLSKELSRSRNRDEIAQAGARSIRQVFEGEVAIFLPEDEKLICVVHSSERFEDDLKETAVAEWVWKHGEAAGHLTSTLPSASALHLPLRATQRTAGVLAFRPADPASIADPAQRNLLETFCNALAVAIERTQLAVESHRARIQTESEKMRNALLSSISHDLRTPLTAIAGAASSLKDNLGDPTELASTIYSESMRLNVQVQNLLDMTRLNSGEVGLNVEWQSLEELVGGALERTKPLLEGRPIHAQIPPEIPLLKLDGELISKALINLLENAASHTPPGTQIDISASTGNEFIRLEIADRGPGIPAGEENKIFERFQRPSSSGGFGLGLAICRTIMKLHKGRIWARNREGGGAIFTLEFPRPTETPEVPVG